MKLVGENWISELVHESYGFVRSRRRAAGNPHAAECVREGDVAAREGLSPSGAFRNR